MRDSDRYPQGLAQPLHEIVRRLALLGYDGTAQAGVQERRHLRTEGMVQDGLRPAPPPPFAHGPRDGRTEVEGEHQGGPSQAQLVQEDVPGLEHAVQHTTHQGAALGAGVGLQSGALVDVGLGDRAHNPVV
ncbi:hypothetical protein ACFWOX_29345 [Streptomyces sp. NPDC058467]|uniref:hypothetical protein n=1 Tax=Streptomyces sp. NPDC058467 TaxID=3346513 RepID=UPI00364B0906